MNREDKLKKLRGSKAAKEMVIISNGEPFIDAIADKIQELKKTLGVGVEVTNVSELLVELEKIDALSKSVQELREAVTSVSLPKSVKIDGLEDLVKATKTLANKKETAPIIQKIDISVLDSIVDGVGRLINKIEELKVPKQGQKPEDYVPMRRVLKVGNTLMFDDSFYTGGGGGGTTTSSSSSSSGNVVITDAGGEAATVTGGKLDVNATASLAGEALPVAGATEGVAVAIVDGSGNQITSFGGGTQYTEDATDASITGTVAMMEVAADTIEPIQGTVADGLLVNLGANNDITGTVTANLSATDNQVLDDIKVDTEAIETAVEAIQAAQLPDGHNVTVDNASLAVTNAGLTELAGAINASAQMDVNLAANGIGISTAAKQDTIIGHVDGIEGLLTTIDADTGNIDTSLNAIEAAVAAEGAALGSGVLLQGDDGTDRKNINVDATTGDVQVDVTNTVTVDGSGVTQPISHAALTELASAINSNLVDVNIVSGAGSGGTAAADDADFTAGTTQGTPAMGVYESTPTTVTDGDLGTVGITSGRRLKTSATIDAALPAGTNNIGDVDVLSSALPTGASTSANQTTIIGHLDGVEGLLTTIDADTSNLSVVGGGTEAAAIRVTIANNSTGVLSIDDNGGAITVDGSVTVSATNLDIRDIDAATDDITIHGDVGVIDQLDLTNSNPAAVAIVDGDGTQITSFGGGTQYSDADANADPTGTVAMGTDGSNIYAVHTDTSGDLQVDVLSSALPTGASTSANQTTIIGHLDGVEGLLTTIDADTGNIATSVQLIDDAIYADDADWTNDTSKHMLVGGLYQSTPQTITDGDVGPFQVDDEGNMKVNIVAGSSSGVQYTDGDIDATVTGTVMMYRSPADDTVKPITDTTGLPVSLVSIDSGLTALSVQGDVAVLSQFDLTNSDPLATAVVDSTGAQVAVATAANQTTIIGHVDGIETAIGTTNTTLTTIDGRVDGLEASNSAIQTATELIDDTVATLGTTTYTEATTKGITIGAVRRDADTTLVNTTNEVAPLQVDANGRLKVEAFSGETLPVSLTSTTVTGTVAVTQSGTWDEVGINDSGNSITVDNGGTFATQLDGAALTALQLIDDTVFTDDGTFTPATSKVSAVGLFADETSTDSVDEGDVGAPRMTLNRQAIVTVRPNASGEGLDIFRSLDLDETEEEVKASAGKIYGWSYHNLSTSYRYLKFYNATAANTTVGTTTPILTIPVKGDTAANVEFVNGIPFSTALSVAVTTGLLDNDTGAPGANEFVINILYK